MIDILSLRNGMEDNLLRIQQINLMIQKEGEEQKGFDDVIHAAQQHIDSINTVYTLGVSWLKDETGFAFSLVQGKVDPHFKYCPLNYWSFELLFILTTDNDVISCSSNNTLFTRINF